MEIQRRVLPTGTGCAPSRCAEGRPGGWCDVVCLAAGATPALWGAETGQPKRGGTLRVRGYDPVHFDPHQTH